MRAREYALRLLCDYEASGKYVNLSLSSHMLDSVAPEERAFVTSLFYTAVEHKLTYDYYIATFAKRSVDKLSDHTKNILRLGICQIVDMKNIPTYAAVNETVKLAKNSGERAFVNGVLRAVSSADELPLPPREKNEARFLSVKYSIPLATVKHFIPLLGADATEKLLAKFNETAPLTLTVNTKRISVCDFIKKLKSAGYTATRAELSPISVRLSESHDPRKLPGFAEGEFFVQDEASALAALVLTEGGAERIADVCSAPGGKSFAMAILSGDNARIDSFDVHESKMSLITSGRDRLGLSSVTASVRDARSPDSADFGSYDAVLCDAPCSGLGVFAKKPDLRYKDISLASELPALQYEILTASSAYLKAGGVMVYSTCTLNNAENCDVVRRFVSENTDFVLEDFTVGALSSEGGMLTLYPHVHNTDGFFIAKLRKNK